MLPALMGLQELIDQNKLFILDASADPDGQDVAVTLIVGLLRELDAQENMLKESQLIQ